MSRISEMKWAGLCLIWEASVSSAAMPAWKPALPTPAPQLVSLFPGLSLGGFSMSSRIRSAILCDAEVGLMLTGPSP